MNDNDFEQMKHFLKKADKHDMCGICERSHEEIRQEVSQWCPIDAESITLMSYKLGKPICSRCYINMIDNFDFVCEVMESEETDVWDGKISIGNIYFNKEEI